jgi:hypothetical protein
MPQREKLDIEKCPVCGKGHSYTLTINRTFIMKMMLPGDFSNRVIIKKYTRIFNCPINNAKFQASFTLNHSSNEEIRSVIVDGICQEQNNATS